MLTWLGKEHVFHHPRDVVIDMFENLSVQSFSRPSKTISGLLIFDIPAIRAFKKKDQSAVTFQAIHVCHVGTFTESFGSRYFHEPVVTLVLTIRVESV